MKRCSVHPHVRGDDDSWQFSGPYVYGSPPRAWGRHRPAAPERPSNRFTPTCVGTTRPLPGIDGVSERFTPTCVGTTTYAWTSSGGGTVHPHVRGDDRTTKTTTANACGSPPRAWGRLHRAGDRRRRLRFTPTCVGTTDSSGGYLERGSVHPHVRGDDRVRQDGSLGEYGSPPRAWGRLPLIRRLRVEDRFTPTCVGTTHPGCRPPACRAVHPHVRGDDTGIWPTYR